MKKMFQLIGEIKNNNKGISMVLVLLVLTVVSILGLALMGPALSNLKMSSSERNYQSVYYIAESGITYATDKVNTNLVDIYNKSDNQNAFFLNIDSMITSINNELPYKNFEKSFGQTPEAKIMIEKINNSNTNVNYRDYKINSKGTIGNQSRTVEKQIRITWVPKNNVTIPDTAVFTNGKIDLSQGGQISGGAGTNSSAPSSIILDGGASITGKLVVGPGSSDNVINKPSWMNLTNEIVKLPTQNTFAMPPFPIFPTNPIPPNEKVYNSNNSFNVIDSGNLWINNWMADNYTLTMTKNLQFNEININSYYTLNINIGNSNRNIVVNNLNVLNGKINIIGTGKLTFYVNNNITMGSGSVINTTDAIENFRGSAQDKINLINAQVNKLDIYYKGSSLNLSGGAQRIYGSLYAQNADITLAGGSGFQGHIISGGTKVNISGGANAITQIFYAPNADITLSQGGTLNGILIAKSYTGSGGSLITNNNFNITELPPIFGGTSGGSISLEKLITTQPTREK